MGLIEAILLGLQFKRLQKPLVFFAMLICFVAFSVFGACIVLTVISEILLTENEIDIQRVAAGLGLLAISGVFFGLAWVCGYLIKRCFE